MIALIFHCADAVVVKVSLIPVVSVFSQSPHWESILCYSVLLQGQLFALTLVLFLLASLIFFLCTNARITMLMTTSFMSSLSFLELFATRCNPAFAVNIRCTSKTIILSRFMKHKKIGPFFAWRLLSFSVSESVTVPFSKTFLRQNRRLNAINNQKLEKAFLGRI